MLRCYCKVAWLQQHCKREGENKRERNFPKCFKVFVQDCSLRQYILSGDWSQCRMTAYVCVKDELCVLGKLVSRGTRIAVPKALRGLGLASCPRGTSGHRKNEGTFKDKGLVAKA